MIPAILEKAAFGIPAVILFFQNRLPGLVLGFVSIDLFLATLFFFAWLRLR